MFRFGVTRVLLVFVSFALCSLVIQAGTGVAEGNINYKASYDALSLSQQWQGGVDHFLGSDPSLTFEQASYIEEARKIGTSEFFTLLLKKDRVALERMTAFIKRAFSLFPENQLGKMISRMGQATVFLAEAGPLNFIPDCNCEGPSDCWSGNCGAAPCVPSEFYLDRCLR